MNVIWKGSRCMEQLLFDTKAFFTKRELESKQELETDEIGNVFLVHYSRHRDHDMYDGKVSDWSEWEASGVNLQVGFAKKLTLFDKICGWLGTGEWKEYKTVMCVGFKEE